MAASFILAGGLLASCSQHRQTTSATLAVQALLHSARPTAAGAKTFNAPLDGYSVRAIRADGLRVESPIDHEGNAVLHLVPGRYSISTSLASACITATVVLADYEASNLELDCVAP